MYNAHEVVKEVMSGKSFRNTIVEVTYNKSKGKFESISSFSGRRTELDQEAFSGMVQETIDAAVVNQEYMIK